MYAKTQASSDLMAISSCYNRNAALLFDNAYKDSLRYQSDQLNRGDQASEGESSSKDICKTVSECNTSSAENFTRAHPTDHHTDRQFGNVALNTWCTPGAHPSAHLVHTWCTPGAHLVNSDHMVHTQIMNTWCTPGAHLVHTWCTPGEQLSWCTPGAHLVHTW